VLVSSTFQHRTLGSIARNGDTSIGRFFSVEKTPVTGATLCEEIGSSDKDKPPNIIIYTFAYNYARSPYKV
jgi:hypothetical protein